MQIDLSNIQIREIEIAEVELLTTYLMAYLAELQGEQNEGENLHRKFGFSEPVYPVQKI